MSPKKHKKWRVVIALASVLAVLTTIFMLMPLLSETVMLRWPLGTEILVAASVPWLLAIITALGFIKFADLQIPSPKPEVRKFNPILILFGVILIFAARIAVMPLENLVPEAFNSHFDENSINLIESGIWPMIAWIICIPILSEWVLRGVVQANLTKIWGIYLSVFTTSIFYGLLFIGRGEVVMGFATSIVLGAIFFLTHSLSTVISVHFLFNGFAYLYYLLFGTTTLLEDFLTGSTDLYIMIWTGSLVLLVYTGWRVRRHELQHKALAKPRRRLRTKTETPVTPSNNPTPEVEKNL